jgi:hypothetical protein
LYDETYLLQRCGGDELKTASLHAKTPRIEGAKKNFRKATLTNSLRLIRYCIYITGCFDVFVTKKVFAFLRETGTRLSRGDRSVFRSARCEENINIEGCMMRHIYYKDTAVMRPKQRPFTIRRQGLKAQRGILENPH